MNIRAILSCWLVLLLGLFFVRCGDSPKVEQEDKVDYKALIQGDWTLKKAYRNNKESVGLLNTFFSFNAEDTMTTNFNMEGTSEAHKYLVRNDSINQQGAQGFIYHIYEVTDSSLVLETNYRGFDFKLILAK